MKLVRFTSRGHSRARWGILDGDFIRPLAGDPLLGKEEFCSPVPVAEARLRAPCQPSKIVAVALNYEGATGQSAGMTEPLVFLKPGTSVCGAGDPVICPFPGVKVWGEAELAIVIGRTVRNQDETEAGRAILGYTSANDVTAENVENRDHHLARSKAADTFCPLGPWIDTDYDPDDKMVEAYQNRELIRRGNSNQRVWRDRQIVSWLSTWMTLQPWDVLLTGTPPRVVPRRYLEPGDVFSVRIEGLGVLENTYGVREVP